MIAEQRHSTRQWILIIVLIIVLIITGLFFARDSGVKISPEKEETLPLSSRLVLQLNDKLFLTRSYLSLRPELTPPRLVAQSVMVTDPLQPLPPTDVQVVNPQTGDRLIVQWKDAVDVRAHAVDIYRSQDEGFPFERVATVARDEEHYIDAAVDVDESIVYRLTSVDEDEQESTPTSDVIGIPTDTIAPPPPTDVVITPTPGKGVVLTWNNALEDDLAGVRIYRSVQKGLLGTLIADTVTGQSAVDETAEIGIEYDYVLTSVDRHGNESSHRILPATGRSNPFIPFYTE
jgi:hypothetical protein